MFCFVSASVVMISVLVMYIVSVMDWLGVVMLCFIVHDYWFCSMLFLLCCLCFCVVMICFFVYVHCFCSACLCFVVLLLMCCSDLFNWCCFLFMFGVVPDVGWVWFWFVIIWLFVSKCWLCYVMYTICVVVVYVLLWFVPWFMCIAQIMICFGFVLFMFLHRYDLIICICVLVLSWLASGLCCFCLCVVMSCFVDYVLCMIGIVYYRVAFLSGYAALLCLCFLFIDWFGYALGCVWFCSGLMCVGVYAYCFCAFLCRLVAVCCLCVVVCMFMCCSDVFLCLWLLCLFCVVDMMFYVYDLFRFVSLRVHWLWHVLLLYCVVYASDSYA